MGLLTQIAQINRSLLRFTCAIRSSWPPCDPGHNFLILTSFSPPLYNVSQI
jgi:hypothetical protein